MRRREFIALLGASTLAADLANPHDLREGLPGGPARRGPANDG